MVTKKDHCALPACGGARAARLRGEARTGYAAARLVGGHIGADRFRRGDDRLRRGDDRHGRDKRARHGRDVCGDDRTAGSDNGDNHDGGNRRSGGRHDRGHKRGHKRGRYNRGNKCDNGEESERTD